MSQVKSIAQWMEERGVRLEELLQACALERRVVEAVLHGRYTPSPQQRQRLAAALGVRLEEVVWGHRAQISHVYGHGPQFGRSP